MGKRDLLQYEQDGQRQPVGVKSPRRAEEPIKLAAHRLAIQFSEDSDLPARYRRLSDPSIKVRKVTKESDLEKRFKVKVGTWRQLIENMLARLSERQAWRFINISPAIPEAINRVTENSDFCDFIDYMILRRDKQQCDSAELGNLSLLSVAFQREVEKQLVVYRSSIFG